MPWGDAVPSPRSLRATGGPAAPPAGRSRGAVVPLCLLCYLCCLLFKVELGCGRGLALPCSARIWYADAYGVLREGSPLLRMAEQCQKAARLHGGTDGLEWKR